MIFLQIFTIKLHLRQKKKKKKTTRRIEAFVDYLKQKLIEKI